jgi:plastocyanin
MTKLFALTLTCLALVAAGCGGDDDSSSGQPAGGYGSGGGGGGTKVSMENVQFSPKDLTVKAGDTVTWVNNDSVPHDVHKTSGPGDDFSSGDAGGMQKGDTFEVTLDKPGKYEYVCELHQPGMTGTLTVK